MSDSAHLIFEYFPELTAHQRQQFERMGELYAHWNEQINVISRKDTEAFYTRHVLHSLAISKVQAFKSGSRILDIGTGGGFPGIPLAILFPECSFLLVDSIGKKIKVVQEVAAALGLTNVSAMHARAETINGKFDFIVSRAVTAMPAFLKWTQGKLLPENRHELGNGILYLKGGDLTEEMKPVKQPVRYFDIAEWFEDPFFETKKVVYVQLNR